MVPGTSPEEHIHRGWYQNDYYDPLDGGSDSKASACNAGDLGLIPGSGRFPGEGNDSSTLAWKIPWTEEPDRLESMGLQRVGHD